MLVLRHMPVFPPFLSLLLDSETLTDIWMQLQWPLARPLHPHQNPLTFKNVSFAKYQCPSLLSPSHYLHQKPQHHLCFWCCSFLFFRKVHHTISQPARCKSSVISHGLRQLPYPPPSFRVESKPTWMTTLSPHLHKSFQYHQVSLCCDLINYQDW